MIPRNWQDGAEYALRLALEVTTDILELGYIYSIDASTTVAPNCASTNPFGYGTSRTKSILI
jgi:hypothetical protein